jgi:hypothetical protein
MRQLDAEAARGAENGFAGANIDLVVVNRERLSSFVAPVTGRFLLVAIVHRAGLGLPMSERLGQFIRKIL